jgi:hypothetical protein
MTTEPTMVRCDEDNSWSAIILQVCSCRFRMWGVTAWTYISKAGNIGRGNLKITTIEYANWTVVAKTPEGNDVVKTVSTVSPKAVQQVIPKTQ